MDTFFADLAQRRRSVRSYLPTPLSHEEVTGILGDAQLAPSNCNTQPWVVHVVSGRTKRELSAALLRDLEHGLTSPDFPFDVANYQGVHAQRRESQGKLYYLALGIGRDDTEGRLRSVRRNLAFFDAPHVAFVFMPPMHGNEVHAAADIGMYAQNFLLSLASRGLAGIAQGILAQYAVTVRSALGVPDDHRLMFGISFGHEDVSGLSTTVHMGRASLGEVAFFHC